MNNVNQRRNKSDSYAFIAVILFLLYSFYYSLLERNYVIQIVLIGFSILFGFFSILTEKIYLNIQKRLLKFMAGWLLIILFFLIFRNWWSVISTIKWCWSIFIVFCICQNSRRLRGIYKAVIIIGFPHVIATLFFIVFQNLYPVMYNVFGRWPGGTRDGRLGFRAGISNHYSLNGIYIAIVFLCCFAYTFNSYKKRKKDLPILGMITLIVFFSLILTMKRAHILFSIIAILLGIIVFAQKISVRQLISLLSIVLILCGIFLWAYRTFPEIDLALRRFENLDEDGNLQYRIKMWEYALHMFSVNPFIGMGWGSFRQTSGYGMNAHNVYIQLLAETGILGFSIYMVTLLILVINAIHGSRLNIKRCCYGELFFSSFASLLILLFYIFYSFSGNCLFDGTFRFFIFTIATTYYLFLPNACENSSAVSENKTINNDENPVRFAAI